ncbi:hypothetical protein JMJ77_0011646 [Colletotrichum scovillei]|uniref:Uncharacterized protein n=1 Tax=Colletotrichum scovillei TaxID=1209932 RepID=A0A9P7UAA4_9PEZI|nr:hypothetical protein JMJ77_0011646 [Colletotrichum scovillei]KAG7045926.1 hypothetical protein JMJ78_0010997 [Colletotrichum scovillei]KAG7063274.1 hypothetical protein JMJ76_0005742 [Colletotrichum scovillei]
MESARACSLLKPVPPSHQDTCQSTCVSVTFVYLLARGSTSKSKVPTYLIFPLQSLERTIQYQPANGPTRLSPPLFVCHNLPCPPWVWACKLQTKVRGLSTANVALAPEGNPGLSSQPPARARAFLVPFYFSPHPLSPVLDEERKEGPLVMSDMALCVIFLVR